MAAALIAFAVFRILAPEAGPKLLARLGVHPNRPAQGHDLTPSGFARREPGRGRAADSPTAIPPRGWADIAWRVLQGFNGDRLMFVAGGVTFFTLLAIFPAIAAFVSLYGLFADSAGAQRDLLLFEGVLPPGVLQFMGDQIRWVASHPHNTLSVAFVGSVLLSIWTANASVKNLIYGLNIAYHETEKRNFVRYTLLTLSFTLGGLAFVLFSSALVIAAPIAAGWLGWSFAGFDLGPWRWPVLFLGYFAMLSVLYRHGPCRQQARWPWLTWGALSAAAASLLFSWLFSTYLGGSARYDRTYGPLGAIMGFMVWTWWSVVVVLVGAEINAEMEHQTARDTTTGSEQPMGDRGALVADTVGPRRGAPQARQFTMDGAMDLSRRLLRRLARRAT